MEQIEIKSLYLTVLGNLDTSQVGRNSSLWDVLTLVTETVQELNISEIQKSNESAAKHRIAGNQLYQERKYAEALAYYTESIRLAEPESDQLGMGYANRSVIYYEQGEFELALYNIDLAKRNNYPVMLMPKLLDREFNCKQQIAAGRSKDTFPCLPMDINVDTNPRIPFLADGIGMTYGSTYGRGMVAEKDFNPGDVILNEKIELCGVDLNFASEHCNHCSSRFNCSLIPCPTCTIFMYCSQECLEQNWKFYHRFECAVATKLLSASYLPSMVCPRLFFYGLTQFDDDLQAMMEYCEKEINVKFNPLDLDYTNLDRLEVFKALHNTKPFDIPEMEYVVKYTACAYYVVLLMNPAVSSIIRTETHRQFFLRTLLQYVRVTCSLTSYSSRSPINVGTISPVYSICNHSCDPNAITINDFGRTKLVILRPVRNGEQIFTYTQTWWCPVYAGVRCCCNICDLEKASQGWRTKFNRDFSPEVQRQFEALKKDMARADLNAVAKLNRLQQFIQRYAERYHPQKNFGMVLKGFSDLLDCAACNGNVALAKAQLRATYAEH